MVNEVVNIEVREDGSRAVESNWNAMATAGEKAGDVSEALQKIMQGVQTTMDKLNSSIDKLNANLSKQSTVVAQVTQTASAGAKATDNLNGSVQKLGETEAQTTARIQAMVRASLEQVAAQNSATAAATAATGAAQAQGAATLQASEAAAASASGYAAAAAAQTQQILAAETFSNTLDKGIKNITQWRDVEGQLVAALASGTIGMKDFAQMTAQLDAQLPNLTASISREAAGVTSLIAKYDPLSAKAAQLAKDEAALQAARDKGIVAVKAYETAMAGLAAEKAALAAATEAATVAEGAATTAHGLNARATRELGTVIEEVATGNVGRLKTSLGALANSTGLLAKLISPLGLSLLGLVAILGILTAGVIKGYEAFDKLNRNMIITGQTSGVTAGQVVQLSESMATVNVNAEKTQELLTGLVGTGRATSQSFETIGKAAQNMLALTGGSVQEVVNDFSKLYDDPIKWANDMDTQWHFLTQDTLDHAQKLIDVGDKYGAAEVIASAFADNTKAKIDELNASMGTLATLIQKWQSGVANIKGFVLNIGVKKDDIQIFNDLNNKYKDWLAQTKGLDSAYIRSVDADFQSKLKALQPAAQNLELLTRTKEAQDQNRQALLNAGKVQDSIHDKTQKQYELEVKLNLLRASYQTTHNLGGTFSNGADKGVSFDAAGNPSGGAYADKVKALEEQYNGKTKAPKAPKSADSLIKDWMQQEQALQSLLGTIDSATAAHNQLEKAQDTLSAAVKRGDITQQQADFNFALYQAQLQDALDPLGALNKKLDEQISAMKGTAQQSKAVTELEKQRQDLLKSGIVLDDKETAALLAKNQAIEAGLAAQRLEEKVLRQVTNATRDQITELEQLNKLKQAGSLSQDQINQYEFQKNPDIFKGTGFAKDQQLKGQQDQLALIKQMNKDKVLNERDTNTAIRNNQLQTQRIQLQGTQQFLGSVATLMNTHNKTQFAIGKAAAIANAGINTYLSATEAFSSLAGIPIVGPILGAIAAAAAVAAGLAQIQQIRSTQMQGYQVGGYTGDMPVGTVAGLVHGQEWVSNAATTARYRPQLEAMHNGTFNPEAQGSQQQATQVQVSQPDIRAIFVDDQRDIGNYLNSDKGERIIVSTVNRNGKRK